MISGLSSAMSGISLATARFDRAAATITGSTESVDDPTATAGDVGTMSDAMVQMSIARFALLASLHVARSTAVMTQDALRLGDYGR